MAKIFVIGTCRFLSSVDGSKLILDALPLLDQQGLLSIQGIMLRSISRTPYILSYVLKISGWMDIILEMLVQCDG